MENASFGRGKNEGLNSTMRSRGRLLALRGKWVNSGWEFISPGFLAIFGGMRRKSTATILEGHEFSIMIVTSPLAVEYQPCFLEFFPNVAALR